MFSLLLSLLLFAPSPELESVSTKNFEIICDNPAHKKYLVEHIEFIKTWSLERWGFEDVDFSKKCVIVCFSSKKKYYEMFHRDTPKVSYDTTSVALGRVSGIWVWLEEDNWRTSIIPIGVTEVALIEYGKKHKINMPSWMIRGVSVLNGNAGSIRNTLVKVSDIFKQDKSYLGIEGLITKDLKASDAECAMCVLWLAKELHLNMLEVLRDKSKLGFNSWKDAEIKFAKYMNALSYDIEKKVTPDSYFLNIFNGKKK